MSKTISTGSILKFKLPFKGYGYCRLVHFTDVLEQPFTLVKIYDHYGIHEKENLDHILEKNYLMNPILLDKFPRTFGKNSWKVLGNIKMSDDGIIPDFKHIDHAPVDDDAIINPWYPLYNFGSERGKKCSHTCIQHLERLYLHTSKEIQIRACMEILRKEDRNIKRYFGLENEHDLYNYYRTINVPDYTRIPEEIRGRALIKNRVPAVFFDYWEKFLTSPL